MVELMSAAAFPLLGSFLKILALGVEAKVIDLRWFSDIIKDQYGIRALAELSEMIPKLRLLQATDSHSSASEIARDGSEAAASDLSRLSDEFAVLASIISCETIKQVSMRVDGAPFLEALGSISLRPNVVISGCNFVGRAQCPAAPGWAKGVTIEYDNDGLPNITAGSRLQWRGEQPGRFGIRKQQPTAGYDLTVIRNEEVLGTISTRRVRRTTIRTAGLCLTFANRVTFLLTTLRQRDNAVTHLYFKGEGG